MSIRLPAPIEQYIRIANSGAPEAVPECFAPDAIVRDEGQTYEGVAAIKNWMAATKKKYRHTITPLELAEHGGQSILKARLKGNFPESDYGELQFRAGRRKDSRVADRLMSGCLQPQCRRGLETATSAGGLRAFGASK